MSAESEAQQAAFFLERYRTMDSEELVQLKAGGLSDIAARAADQVLQERGLTAETQREVLREAQAAPAPTAWASGRLEHAASFSRFPLRAFLGLEALWKVYWIAGWLGSVAMFVVASIIMAIVQSFSMALGGVVASVFFVAYMIWWSVAVWRCAFNVRPDNGLMGWLARGSVVLNVVLAIAYVAAALQGR